jgi:hypothetical protein
MQKWEYKTILRSRGWGPDPQLGNKAMWMVAGSWDVGLDDLLEQLGNEGWELVSVSPRSSYLGGATGNGGLDYAGYTSQELWIFKRQEP